MKLSNIAIDILGVQVHPVTVLFFNECLSYFIYTNGHILILNVNVNCLNLSYENNWLKSFLNRAEIVFCDGAGVQLAARILGHRIPERITYADWMWQLADYSAERDLSLFFLGGKPGVAEKAAQSLHQ